MKQVIINLYSFEELNEKARNFAINEHGNFLEEVGQEFENEDGEMETDYTRPSDEDVIDNILANEYVYFEDGKLAKCTTYTGNHHKSGVTELDFHGRIYTI